MPSAKDPDILRLVDGQLVCSDGSDVQKYLRQWAVSMNISADEPINLIRGVGLAELRFGYFMYRHHAA